MSPDQARMGDGFLPEWLVKREIATDIARVTTEQAGGLRLESFAIFKSHSPYSVVLAPERIRDGLDASEQALQGHRDAYYAGVACQTHSSAAVWAHVASTSTPPETAAVKCAGRSPPASPLPARPAEPP